jgi:NAD(P)H-hydrate epimerase
MNRDESLNTQPEVMTVAQSREFDRTAIESFGIPGIVLMENAGKNAADFIRRMQPSRAVVLCGSGNNGGDGFVIARHLANHHVGTETVCLGSLQRLSADALVQFQIVRRLGLTIHEAGGLTPAQSVLDQLKVSPSGVIVDAILGTGGTGTPRAPFDTAIRWANAQPGKRIAIDVPSGLDGDTGVAADPTFLADCTITFVAAKAGLMVPAAVPFVGRIEVVDIGLSLELAGYRKT